MHNTGRRNHNTLQRAGMRFDLENIEFADKIELEVLQILNIENKLFQVVAKNFPYCP